MLNLSAQTNAWLRHVYTALGTAVALLVYLGVSPDDQARIVAAVHQIGDGFASILGGLAVLVPIATALYARFTAKPAQQIAAVNAMPNAQVVPVDVSQPLTAPAAKVSSHWLLGLLGVLLLLPLGGCVITNSDGTPIVVTASNTPAVVLLSLQKGCQYYQAASGPAVIAAVETALQASEKVQATTSTVETLAAIACGLLAPPPATKPAG